MWKLLRRLKVLHLLTGILVTIMGAASNNKYAIIIGIGIVLVCVIRKF